MARRELKKQSDKKVNFYLSIVEFISQNKRLPDMFNSHQAMNYYLKPLKVASAVYKLSFGTWDVDWDKFNIFYTKELKKQSDKKVKKTKQQAPIIRGHGYQFWLRIPERISWRNRETILNKSNKVYKKLSNGTIKSRFLGNKVWFCEKGIVIYFSEGRSFYEDSDQAEKEAIYYFKRILKRIENTINLDLSYKGKYLFTMDKAHYGKIQDELAKHCNKDNQKIRCVLNGKEWLIIDNSFNLNELETTAKTSKKDMDKVVMPFMNDLKEHFDKTGESITITPLLKLMKGIMSNQVVFDANMASHISAVKKLGDAVDELTEQIKRNR